MRLRTVSCHEPGWRRVRHGRGFRYLDVRGEPLRPEEAQRVRDLVIPPAWTEVWISPHPRGHLQAVGTDADGRRQYLYHPQWRIQRDIEKFERVAAFGARLPKVRQRLRRDLRAEPGDDDVERRRVLALAVRLLDLGCFRPGSDASAEAGSHGLTTLERSHVRKEGDALRFSFNGKANIEQSIVIADPEVVRVLGNLLRHRRSDSRVLASKVAGRWVPVPAEELNRAIADLAGPGITAKDFRTWHATAAAAATLAQKPLPESRRKRERRVRDAMAAAADLLGNTPTVARTSYVDPRVVDLFDQGVVLDPVPGNQTALDRAVTALLENA